MSISVLVLSFVLLIIAMTVHEFFHGWTAYKLGDNTAKFSGRLTLNPLAHIDPIWTLLVPIFLFISTGGRFIFGSAKPVPINYWALKNPKRDIVWIGASGPLANLLFAFLTGMILKYVSVPVAIKFILTNLIVINVVLGVFNLIPIPPLDGSRVLMGLLPNNIAAKFMLIEPFGFIILLGLIWLGAFDYLVWPVVGAILKIFGINA